MNAEDASRTEVYTKDKRYDDYLVRFIAAKKYGADRIRYCDTLAMIERFPFTIA